MFKRLWFQIHWLLGLVSGFVLVIVSLSGAALSYEKEILRAINKDIYTVSVPQDANKLPLDLLLVHVREALKIPIQAVTLSSDPRASMGVIVLGEGVNAGHGVTHYVDPYTGEILPALRGLSFFQVMHDLHRRLTFGSVGKQIVGASSLLLLVLVVSGIYLYWPRIRRSFGSSLTFNFKSKGRYFLYSMHSAVGMWVTLLYVLAVLTGLYWSYDWYRGALHNITNTSMPMGHGHNKGMFQSAQAQQPQEGTKRGQGGGRGKASSQVSYVPVAQAWTLFDTFVERPYESALLRIPASGGTYSFSYLDENPLHPRARNQLNLDLNTNQLLSHDRYEDKPLNERLMRSMLPLHSGEYFGEVGRALMFAACVLMLLFFVTGVMLYVERFKRERKKKRRQNT
ncbi:MAG: PepSY domain-containing protein [Campylobacterales bacterium]|nr:PepSY domain-containing protein [Campylobacterales bacterium]